MLPNRTGLNDTGRYVGFDTLTFVLYPFNGCNGCRPVWSVVSDEYDFLFRKINPGETLLDDHFIMV